MNRNSAPKRSPGFSIFEVLMAVAAVSILSAIGVASIVQVTKSTETVKLDSDRAALNSAVSSYLLFGGNFDGTETVDQVFIKLKSKANNATADQVVGLQGSFLDHRYEPVIQSDDEGATNAPRLHWDPAKNKFVEATSGAPGITEFRVNEDFVAPEAGLTETRETAVDYAHESTWIWDYEDLAAPAPLQPTPITVALVTPPTPVPISGTPPSPITPPPSPTLPPGPAPTALLAPVFSIPSGSFPITDFDLALSITDPNPAGSSVFYSINAGPWSEYTGGTLTIGPGDAVWAQAIPTAPEYLYSTLVVGNYPATPVALDAPTLNLSDNAFILPTTTSVAVTIDNPNDPTVSQVQYSIDGSAWQLYTSGFSVTATDYPAGLTIDAYSASLSPFWLDSAQASDSVLAPVPDLTFTSSVSTGP